MNSADAPGLKPAYEFVLPSYTWAIQRLEASTRRLQGVQTYAATLTLSAPIIVKGLSPTASLNSPWFYAAVVVFLVIGVMAIGSGIIRASGGLALVDPSVLAGDDWLGLSEDEFRLEMLKVAGRDFNANIRVIERRASLSDFLTLLLLVEVVLLAFWANSQL